MKRCKRRIRTGTRLRTKARDGLRNWTRVVIPVVVIPVVEVRSFLYTRIDASGRSSVLVRQEVAPE